MSGVFTQKFGLKNALVVRATSRPYSVNSDLLVRQVKYVYD